MTAAAAPGGAPTEGETPPLSDAALDEIEANARWSWANPAHRELHAQYIADIRILAAEVRALRATAARQAGVTSRKREE